MRIDAIKQFARLHQQLLAEKQNLESRLREINEVLQTQPAVPEKPILEPMPAPRRQRSKRARRARGGLSQREAIIRALRERGPLTRKELAAAIKELGYVSKAKDPMNSMGIVLYAKNAPFKKKDGKFYLPPNAQVAANNAAPPLRKKRTISEAGKARIAAAQRARWAKTKRTAAASAG